MEFRHFLHTRTAIRVVCSLLIVCVIIACKGPQEQSKVAQEAEKIVQEPSGEFNEPLFGLDAQPYPVDRFAELFYEGQLCHWIRGIFEDSMGQLWFGTNHYGVMRYDGESLRYFTPNEGFTGTRVTAITEDQDGNLWFGTWSGLGRYDGQHFSTYSEEDGLVNTIISSLIIDNEGMMWLGTMEGVVQFDGQQFRPFMLPETTIPNSSSILSPGRVSSIYQDSQGHFWFGTDGRGLFRYDGSDFVHFSTENGLPDNVISQVFEDSKGNLWIGTMLGGITLYDGSTFTNFNATGLAPGVEIAGLYEEDDGSVWFSAEGHGVYRYNGNRFDLFYEEHGLITKGINSIYKDSKGRFWFGGWKGLFQLKDNQFTPVTKQGPWN